MCFARLQITFYIIHIALCMHFLSLQIYLFNSLSYILHNVCAFFVYASIFQVFKLDFAFYNLCLCTMYAFFVCIHLLLKIMWLCSTLCLCMCVCAHCVCSTLYKIFAIFILNFGCYLCVEVYHWRFEVLHFLIEKLLHGWGKILNEHHKTTIFKKNFNLLNLNLC